jgi:ribosomal-protein-alanine N-acetyltransferase
MSPLPTFKTKRLILKQLEESHADAYRKNFVDYEIIRHLASVVPWPYPDDGVELFLKGILPQQGKGRWLWGIFVKENPTELIGVVDLWRDGQPENRGVWLGRPYWGKGYMTEAVTPVMNYAFDDLGFETLVFANALGNERSRRVKEKTGARLVATKPAKFVDPTLTHQEIWELKKNEWIDWTGKQT